MDRIEKYQTLIIFVAMPIGLLFGLAQPVEQYAENFIIPFLFLMLFGVFLNIPLKNIGKAFTNIKFTGTTVAINFLFAPLLAWLLGRIFLSNAPILQIGFIMIMVTPCTDWYLVFTSKAKGNLPLSASVLPSNLILQVVMLPIYLLAFAGVQGSADIQEILVSIAIMLILPFALAQIGKFLLGKVQNESINKKVSDTFGSLQTILLALAIMAMFASKGRSLLANLNVVVSVFVPIVLFFIVIFVLCQIVGKCLRYSYEDTASLTLTTSAKNALLTLGVALMVFPDEPLIHLMMVIEPLIELPILTLKTKVLLAIRNSNRHSNQ